MLSKRPKLAKKVPFSFSMDPHLKSFVQENGGSSTSEFLTSIVLEKFGTKDLSEFYKKMQIDV